MLGNIGPVGISVGIKISPANNENLQSPKVRLAFFLMVSGSLRVE
jgi:hypothetical protein